MSYTPTDLETRFKALSIAASVFSHLSSSESIRPEAGEPYIQHGRRTLKDFRGSVDAVFKAAGLEKVEWEID